LKLVTIQAFIHEQLSVITKYPRGVCNKVVENNLIYSVENVRSRFMGL